MHTRSRTTTTKISKFLIRLIKLVMLLTITGVLVGYFLLQWYFQRPPLEATLTLLDKINAEYLIKIPALFSSVTGPAYSPLNSDFTILGVVGPQNTNSYKIPNPEKNIKQVEDINALLDALETAKPGSQLIMSPGSYRVTQSHLGVAQKGTVDSRMTLMAENLGDVTIKLDSVDGFLVVAPYWTFKNLIIEGNCADDSRCEHAFHVMGAAHHTEIHNNIIVNFNAAIKVNASNHQQPNDGFITNNAIFNSSPRQTAKPVTPVDIVAASNWTIARNFIADFAKDGGDYTSYGAFAKGAGTQNLFEQNIILCEWQHSGGKRIGISLGGGGTGARYCADEACLVEQGNSTLRNNIIGNCPMEVGLYLNQSQGSEIYNNLFFNTRGIDLSGDQTTTMLYNNIIDGRVVSKNGAQFRSENNISPVINALLNTPISKRIYTDTDNADFTLRSMDLLEESGTTVTSSKDICGNELEAPPVIGPINYLSRQLCVAKFSNTLNHK